jgi:hypothetical protein
MRKYIITSPAFTGEIHVLYGTDDKLVLIDFMKSDLTEEQINYFKTQLPALYSEKFKESFGSSRLAILEEGFRVTFEQFWNRYETKINRIRAEKQWNKLSEADQVNAFVKYALYDRHLKLNPWKNKVDPERYLKDRYWESEWK